MIRNHTKLLRYHPRNIQSLMCYYKLLFWFFQKTCIMKSNNVIFHFLDIPYEGGWREKRGRGADGCFDQLIWCFFSLLSLFSLHLSLILWKSEGHWGLLCLFRVSLLSASLLAVYWLGKSGVGAETGECVGWKTYAQSGALKCVQCKLDPLGDCCGCSCRLATSVCN